MDDDDLDEFTAALQDVVLPAGVPVVPGLEIAAHFSVPADPGESTGAWFDVIVLGSGRIGLAIGQVPGSGLPAVVAAGGVAAVLRAGLLRDEDVVRALDLAALHAEHVPDAAGTAVAVAVLDLAEGEVVYATAGREAPVVCSPDGPSRQLTRSGAGALGSGDAFVASRETLAVGDLVLVASGNGATPSTERLDRSAVPGDAAATCTAYAGLVATEQLRGAVSVVVARLDQGRPGELDLDLALDDTTSLRARRELESWLSTLGATHMDVLSLVHATAELVTNAIEHAYDAAEPRAGARLRATHAPTGEVLVEVIDQGRWRNPSDDISRGRGLAMAAGLVDALDVVTDENGTRASLRHRLSRPVSVDRVPARPTWPVAEPLELVSTGPGAVRLTGEFGHDEVDEITYALLLASRGRTQAVEIDLSDLTAISAGGLRVLGDLVRTSSGRLDDPPRFVLRARRGSPSQTELERAGITHRAS